MVEGAPYSLRIFFDADYAGCAQTQRSPIGAVVFLHRKVTSFHTAELGLEVHFGRGDSRHGHCVACCGASVTLSRR